MIIYNKFYELFGMGKKALEILEYDDLEDFLQHHKDIDELAQNYEKKSNDISFIQDILSSPKNTRRLFLKTKKDRIITVNAKASSVFFKDSQQMFELEFFLEDGTLDDIDKKCEMLPQLRLPKLQNQKRQTPQKSFKSILINEQWLNKTKNILELEENELVMYLKIFIKGVSTVDISLQNALITKDENTAKKIIKRLNEPAKNLRISPLVKIYSEVQNSTDENLKDLILQSKDIINQINNLINKYQEN